MGLMIEFPDIQVFRETAFYTIYFCSGEFRFDVTRDGSGYLILKLENRFLGAIEPIAPETVASMLARTQTGSPLSYDPMTGDYRVNDR